MWTSTDDAIPFDRVAPEAIEPAVLAGMTAFRDELAAIANSPDAPTFANTIAALDNAGRTFNRASSLLSIHTSTLATPAMQATEARLAPVLAAFGDELIQNAALFARIRAVHDAGTKDLAPDEARLVELTYQSFARNGAALNDADKARMAAINQRLAVLFTTFSQKLLADEESQSVVLDDGSKIANTRSAVEPFLTYSTRRDLRERVWRMFVERGDASMIPEILALRNEKAKLLGFPTFAHWVLDDKMAKTPEAALELMMSVWPAARDRAREEVRDMEKLAGHPIEPWDYRFYAEKVRKERYEIDEDEVKNYFQLDNMREGMFWAAQQLYGLDFTRIDVPVYHPDVTVYEVTRGRGADRARVGLWYFDPFARDGKRSGAWMDEWRAQERYFTEQTPIVTNVANFLKPASGPTLISFDDARTLFHEFGHALHGLSSNVRFPGLAGTRVLRDFVEFPSQINERWFTSSELLEKFALHHATGEALPAAIRTKLERAKTFQSGFKTVELLACAIYDLRIHMERSADAIDPLQYETALMAELDMPKEIVMRHRPPQFGHVFSGDGYAAGYYSYVWADTLVADAAEAFEEAGSFYDRATAKRLFDTILSVGGSVAPDVAFRAFRGRDVDTRALMRDRGFV